MNLVVIWRVPFDSVEVKVELVPKIILKFLTRIFQLLDMMSASSCWMVQAAHQWWRFRLTDHAISSIPMVEISLKSAN